VYQLGALFKNQQEIIKDQLEIKRAIALQNQGSQTTREEADLRAVGAMSWSCIHSYLHHLS